MDIKILATGSSGNCYHVSDGTTEILIECGIKYTDIEKKLDYKMDKICAALISHSHKDHSLSAKTLLSYGIELYMPLETALELNIASEIGVNTPKHGEVIFLNKNGEIITKSEDKKDIDKVSYVISPFYLVHCNSDGSNCPCYGYVINSAVTGEKLLFATDTAYIKNTFKAVDYMLIEVNYMTSIIDGGETEDFVTEVEKRRLKSHMSLETAVEFLERSDRSKLKTLYAIHGSSKRLDKDEAYRILEPYAERVIVP